MGIAVFALSSDSVHSRALSNWLRRNLRHLGFCGIRSPTPPTRTKISWRKSSFSQSGQRVRSYTGSLSYVTVFLSVLCQTRAVSTCTPGVKHYSNVTLESQLYPVHPTPVNRKESLLPTSPGTGDASPVPGRPPSLPQSPNFRPLPPNAFRHQGR